MIFWKWEISLVDHIESVLQYVRTYVKSIGEWRSLYYYCSTFSYVLTYKLRKHFSSPAIVQIGICTISGGKNTYSALGPQNHSREIPPHHRCHTVFLTLSRGLSSALGDKLPPGFWENRCSVWFGVYGAHDRNRVRRPHDVFDKCVFNVTTANENSFQR